MKRLALLLLVAACSPAVEGPRSPDDAALARGRAEREFWACYDRARQAFAGGDVEGARTAYEQALVRRPEHEASLYALAGIEHRAGHHEKALALADRLLVVDRPRTRALLFRAAVRSDVEAVLAGRSGPWFDLALAESDAADAERENPEETGPHIARARIALLRGDAETARISIERALTIHSRHAEAFLLRSRCGLLQGAPDEARQDVASALAVTRPKDDPLPAGEGDTAASRAPPTWFDPPRLRALAAALSLTLEPWPDHAPAAPPVLRIRIPETGGTASRTVRADFDGDGTEDTISATRASEADALRSLFRAPGTRSGSFRVEIGGADRTAGSGLDGFAACVASLVATDADGDGRPDVVVLPGRGDPSRFEPALLLRNEGGGRFTVFAALPQ